MIRDCLQRRDLEILRTLARLRYLTTREIVGGFFASPAVGRRRLRRLSSLELITSHRRGVPDDLQYYAWRLTVRGLEVVAESFADEPLGDGLADRLAEGSLRYFEHRAGLTRVYLGLLQGAAGPAPDDASVTALRSHADALRARASQLFVQPDGEVTLRFRTLADDAVIVPDATMWGRSRLVRVFVELDRSTRVLSRIDENLGRYATFFRHAYDQTYPDGRTPGLLYIVRSQGRRSGIHALAKRILGDAVAWAVLLEQDAIAWLEAALLDPAASAAAPTGTPTPDLPEVAADLYRWAIGYEKELRAEGRSLPSEGRTLLRELRQRLLASGLRRAG